MSSNGILQTPETMPASEVQRIANLKCPPPLLPSKLTPKLNAAYKNMLKQDQQISLLETQIEDLEKRYLIAFSASPLIKYDLSPSQKPYVDVSGSLQNIILEFHLWPARKGMQGLPGVQGEMGNVPPSNTTQGILGYPGYYGVRGNNSK